MKIKYLILSVLFTFPFFTHAETIVVEKSWFNLAYQADGSGFQLTARFQATVPGTMNPGQTGIVTGFASKEGTANIRPQGAHECPQGVGCFPVGNFIFTSPGSFIPNNNSGGLTNIGTFTAPMTPGNYQMGFFALFDRDPAGSNWCRSIGGVPSVCTTPFSYGAAALVVVSPPASTACDDGNDNDGDGLVDANDPRCHTNCIISNPLNPAASGSYIRNPAFNSENNPACPVPAPLQLNGRAAFFQVVKNFFASITARAFAGE